MGRNGAFHISCAYSTIFRSVENQPMCAFVADREVSLSPARTSFFATNSTAADSRTPDLPLCNYAMFNERDKNHAKADWQFTIANAHLKLKRTYPAL